MKLFYGTLLLCLFLINTKVSEAKVYLGIDVLQQRHFDLLQGKRIGLLTHPAGVNRTGTSTIDILWRSPTVKLVALYGPEHGIYGDEKANKAIQDRIDPRTQLPVYSLYGEFRKPTAAMLAPIDTMVIDLQDIGVRSYTYVSCMKLVLEACFSAGKEVIVLDRPNPLGGLKVDGPPRDKQWYSYVGVFPTPYVHGLTIGELARMSKEIPGWLDLPHDTRKKGILRIVPMRGWQRSMLWPQTKLRWVATSPYIQDLSAVLGYAMVGLGCQLGDFKHGLGKHHPFRLLTYPHKSPEDIQKALSAYNIPGLSFPIRQIRSPNGQIVRAPYVHVKDWNKLRPTEVSFYLMQLSCIWEKENPFQTASAAQARLYNKHVGSTAWWQAISQQGSRTQVSRFITQWQQQARAFQQQSRSYWLYR